MKGAWHTPGRPRIYHGQDIPRWQSRQKEPRRTTWCGPSRSPVASMGRFAAHTGQVVTFDQMMNHDQEFAPDVDN